LCSGGCYCEDISGRVPGCEVGAVEEELAAGVPGSGIPDTDCVVFAAGDEVVLAWMERETRDVFLVAFEVAQVGVVVG
jgi:hypothetical protein